METTKTKTRQSRTVVAAAPKISEQERYDRDYADWEPGVLRMLGWRLEYGRKAREEFLVKVGRGQPGDLAYQCAWGENLVKSDYESSHATAVIAHYEEQPAVDDVGVPKSGRERLIQALRHYVEQFTRQLVRDQLRANSTGHFHRAAESTERAAIASSLEAFSSYVNQYDRIEERGRKLAGQ